MGVVDVPLTATITVSFVLKAVPFAVSQILSAAWALTFITRRRLSTSAKTNVPIDFMSKLHKWGRTLRSVSAPPSTYYLWITNFPDQRTGLSVVAGQQFQIQNVDDIVVIQIGSAWGGGVVVHPDRQRIELINDIVAVNVTCQERDRWLGVAGSRGEAGRTLGTEEAAGSGDDRIGAGRSGQAKGPVVIGCHRSHEGRSIVESDRHGLSSQHLSGEGAIGQSCSS